MSCHQPHRRSKYTVPSSLDFSTPVPSSACSLRDSCHSRVLDPLILKDELPMPHLTAYPSSPFKHYQPTELSNPDSTLSTSHGLASHSLLAGPHPSMVHPCYNPGEETLPPNLAASDLMQADSPHPSHWANWEDEFHSKFVFSDLKLSFSTGSRACVSVVALPSTPRQ